jgi:deazaflavin-dependent oxidoreductase (nitroreductase family)
MASEIAGLSAVGTRQVRDAAVIADLRAHSGRTSDGRVLVILSTTGSKTGLTYQNPVCVCEDADDLVVAASAAGQPKHPQWFRNAVAHPRVGVEYLGQSWVTEASVEPNSLHRNDLFQRLHQEIGGLYGYQDRCREDRQIPIVRLRRA